MIKRKKCKKAVLCCEESPRGTTAFFFIQHSRHSGLYRTCKVRPGHHPVATCTMSFQRDVASCAPHPRRKLTDDQPSFVFSHKFVLGRNVARIAKLLQRARQLAVIHVFHQFVQMIYMHRMAQRRIEQKVQIDDRRRPAAELEINQFQRCAPCIGLGVSVLVKNVARPQVTVIQCIKAVCRRFECGTAAFRQIPHQALEFLCVRLECRPCGDQFKDCIQLGGVNAECIEAGAIEKACFVRSGEPMTGGTGGKGEIERRRFFVFNSSRQITKANLPCSKFWKMPGSWHCRIALAA